jgi:hypothetical protein
MKNLNLLLVAALMIATQAKAEITIYENGGKVQCYEVDASGQHKTPCDSSVRIIKGAPPANNQPPPENRDANLLYFIPKAVYNVQLTLAAQQARIENANFTFSISDKCITGGSGYTLSLTGAECQVRVQNVEENQRSLDLSASESIEIYVKNLPNSNGQSDPNAHFETRGQNENITQNDGIIQRTNVGQTYLKFETQDDKEIRVRLNGNSRIIDTHFFQD